MPNYLVTSPDGKKFKITAPEGATQDQVLSYAKAHWGSLGGAAPSTPPAPTPGVLSSIGAGAGKGFGESMLGLQQLVGKGLSELPIAKTPGDWLQQNAAQGIAKLQQQAGAISGRTSNCGWCRGYWEPSSRSNSSRKPSRRYSAGGWMAWYGLAKRHGLARFLAPNSPYPVLITGHRRPKKPPPMLPEAWQAGNSRKDLARLASYSQKIAQRQRLILP